MVKIKSVAEWCVLSTFQTILPSADSSPCDHLEAEFLDETLGRSPSDICPQQLKALWQKGVKVGAGRKRVK